MCGILIFLSTPPEPVEVLWRGFRHQIMNSKPFMLSSKGQEQNAQHVLCWPRQNAVLTVLDAKEHMMHSNLLAVRSLRSWRGQEPRS